MNVAVGLVCGLLILWALELRFKEYQKCFEQIAQAAEGLKERVEKLESDMVNVYLKKN
ncbi:MAG: hypothetical protein ACOY3D_00925 [Candidatus Omnitrophota bacterium]